MKKSVQIIPTLFLSLFSHLAIAQCPAATNLTATYNNNVSTFSWDPVPGAQGYIFEIKLQWNPWGSGNGLTLTNPAIDLTGLFQTAPLDWRVTIDCGNGLFSTPTASTYSTPCPVAINPVVSNITGTTATVSWTAPAGYNTTTTNFSIGYRLANTNNAWTSAGTTSATSKTIAGLISNTSYEFCITTSCMYGNSTPLTGIFTTAYVACNIPTSISVTSATYNQATISWALVPGALNYTIEYKPATGSVWSSVTSATSPRILTGLTSATLYDIRIKANCASTSSNYISSQFTTYSSACPAWGVNSSEYIDLVSLGSINRTSGREVGGYYNTGISTSLSRGSNNAGQFSAGYNPGIIFAENFAVYIDFNRNGSFSDAGERVVNPTSVTSGAAIYNFNVAIPHNVSTGITKMRVIICRSGTTITPCQFTNFKGEVEDYNINIVNNLNRMANSASDDFQEVIEDTVFPDLSVYPNPSTGIFNIQLPAKGKATYYEIMNSNGAIIEKKNITSQKSFIINLSKQSNGLYLVNVISAEENKKHTLKLNLVK